MNIENFTAKELTVWAVVINKIVAATHVGPPELYNNPLSEEYDISLIQFSQDRGFPKIGDLWDGERFRKSA